MGSNNSRIKVLVVCMFDSIHSARWLSQFQEKEIDFLLFPSSPHRRVHNQLKNLLSNPGRASFRLVRGSRFFGLPFWLLDRFLGNSIRGGLLKKIAFRTKPNVVHALELQNAGYVSLRAFEALGGKKDFQFIVTNWGSDIYWFQNFPKHKAKLRKLLALADEYSCECNRDVTLAKNLGFRGVVKPVFPNAGGFSDAELELGKFRGERKSIAIKGYQGWVGRAKVALDALTGISKDLSDLEINVYSANWSTIRHAKKIERKTGLKINVFGKGELTHQEMLGLFAKSRVYVGLSLSDGISTSLLEAMAMGAIPVQTSTACCDEWFSDSGVAVGEISASAVASAILQALELAKSGRAAEINRNTIFTRARAEVIRAGVSNFYG